MEYLDNLKRGISTAFEGLSISLASMFVRPATVQYPEVDITNNESIQKRYKGQLMGMPDNYRGILDVKLEVCTACQLCMKACPIDCIIIDNVKCDRSKVPDIEGGEQTKTRTCTRFEIDIAKCMFCGLCVQPCPTGAIRHTKQFEMNRHSLDQLVKSFVSEEEKIRAETRAAEIAKEDAEKKAAKKKKEAEAKIKDKEEKVVDDKSKDTEVKEE